MNILVFTPESYVGITLNVKFLVLLIQKKVFCQHWNLHGVADILRGMASISSGMPYILHIQHPFLGFPKGKRHFLPEVLKNCV